MLNGDHRGDGGCAGTAQVVAAQRVARQLVLGFELCADSGVPLSELQKIALFSAALLEFDGMHAEVEGRLQIDRLLGELHDLDDPASANGV